MTRHRAKVDANQAEIKRVVETVGGTFQSIASVGSGCPDALVGYRGRNYLWEIKDGDKPPSARALTPDERHWHDWWCGEVAVIESPEDALEALGVRKKT